MKELELYSSTGRKVSVQWTPDGILVSTLIKAEGTRSRTKPPRAKLSKIMVQNIRRNRSKSSEATWDYCKRLGKAYGVTPAAISHVLSKRTWKNV